MVKSKKSCYYSDFFFSSCSHFSWIIFHFIIRKKDGDFAYHEYFVILYHSFSVNISFYLGHCDLNDIFSQGEFVETLSVVIKWMERTAVRGGWRPLLNLAICIYLTREISFFFVRQKLGFLTVSIFVSYSNIIAASKCNGIPQKTWCRWSCHYIKHGNEDVIKKTIF